MSGKTLRFIGVYFIWCVIAEGNGADGRNLYISSLGNDSRSCDQSNPCKTIWRSVTLASRGDHIHLDGANTDKDPYTCQSGTSEHPGVYINKSLSLIGSASLMPQIRCTEGTGLTLNGSDNAEQMNVTLSGLLVNESFVSVQDSSVNIDGCKFTGSKQGVQIVIRTRMVLSIQITNSTFSNNSECISVVTVVNSTKNQSKNTQVVFELTSSSFDANQVLSEEGRCISFTKSPYNDKSLKCNITMKNVTFSGNKFSSKGLVFLEIDYSNHFIHLQNVTFIDNSPSLGRDVLTVDGDSEFVVRSTDVNIFINSSSFTSHCARLFNVSASNISLQIYNSSFCGHRVEGNGGVVSLEGTDVCKLIVSNSSFVNTTAAQGGAINIECSSVDSVSFGDNVFTDNTARNGDGGAVYIYSPGLVSNDSRYSTVDEADKDYSIQGENSPQINITKCDFTNAYSSFSGGAVYIKALKTSVRLHHSAFINCTGDYGGGGVYIDTFLTPPKIQPGIDLLLIVESCRFVECTSVATFPGGSLSVLFTTEVQISINNSHFISNHGGAFTTQSPSISSKNISYVTVEHSTFLHNVGSMKIVLFIQNIIMFDNVTMEWNKAGAGDIGNAVFFCDHCSLRIHRCHIWGGAFMLLDANVVEVQDSCFGSNYDFLGSQGGALHISVVSRSTSIVISNTTFSSCSAELQGGAIYLSHGGNVSVAVKRSRFLDNSVRSGERAHGGAIYLSLAPDAETNSRCVEEGLSTGSRQISDANEFPSWDYKNHVIFEDSTFDRNTGGAGGAVYLINGKATFRNCSFIDNFAATQGGHIYTVIGSASLIVQDSVFRQTLNKLQLLDMNYTKASFIHADSSGALIVHNTTLDATPYGSTGLLIIVRNGRLIDLGKNNSTTFNCPVGSQMEILNFTDQVTTQVNNKPCKFKLSTLAFSCSACEGNSYSLQRGGALGSLLVPGFQCLPCPFGANCSQNILAKPNFWGFKEKLSPPTLKFTMCPLGYCSPPQPTDFPEYNGCQGNRSGELCGHCNAGYTETLYSTSCRQTHECEDYWFWPVALLYVSLMALCFTFTPPIVPWIMRQLLWFKNHEPENEDNDFDRGYLKIIFFFYQAGNLLLVSNSSQHIFKTKFVKFFVGLFNFEPQFLSSGLICPLPGLSVVTKQLFSVSYVFGTYLMIGAFYCLHWGAKKCRGQGAPSVDPYIGGILQTMLLGYKTLASVSFDLLSCVPIGSDKRLFFDGNVVCFQFWQYILIAFICTSFVPFVFVLFWGSFKLYGGTISVGKFILACYFPLPFLLYWTFLCVSCKVNSTASENSHSGQISTNSVEKVLYDSFKSPGDGRKLSFSWESVMIGRRLILIVLKAFVSDPLPRLLIMSFSCVLFLQHHSMTQPFRDGFANTVETISLLCVVLLGMINMFFASFLSLSVPLNDHFSSWWNVCQGVEIVILCAVPAVFGLLVVAAVLSQVCRITFVVCRFLCTFCWICFSGCCSNQNDETRPLASVS